VVGEEHLKGREGRRDAVEGDPAEEVGDCEALVEQHLEARLKLRTCEI